MGTCAQAGIAAKAALKTKPIANSAAIFLFIGSSLKRVAFVSRGSGRPLLRQHQYREIKGRYTDQVAFSKVAAMVWSAVTFVKVWSAIAPCETPSTTTSVVT